MNVLFIATRSPYGKMIGHKVAMRTYIQSLQRLGHEVVVIAFSIPGDDPGENDLGAVTMYLRLPPRWRIAWNVFRKGLLGPLSINECIYHSREAQRIIPAVVDSFAIDLVVADMIRTAGYADATGVPWLLDLDDLLSERYAMGVSQDSSSGTTLGYLENAVPAVARPAAIWIFKRLMEREAKVVAQREAYWSHHARSASLHSIREVAAFRERSACRVFCMPIAIPIPRNPAESLEKRPMSAVFVGALTFKPNLEALEAYATQIIPEFESRREPVPVLNVVGNAPDHLSRRFRHPSLRFLGYVPDASEAIRNAQVFFAPIISGTGIKTKVLDALAAGVPVIAYPKGLVGLYGTTGVHYLRADNAGEFVDHYIRLRDNPPLAHALAEAGRTLAKEYYSIEATSRVLEEELKDIEGESAKVA